MLNRPDARFNQREWACLSVQAPLGKVILARKLPDAAPAHHAAGATIEWSSRRFAPSNPPGPAAKKARPRRAP
jgi:hypothetical protein